MIAPLSPFLGVGIYTVPEAARLTGVHAKRLRRWLRGYRWGESSSDSVWAPDLPPIDGELALSFRDLIEARWVDFFRSQGVAWTEIRRVAAEAAETLDTTHPFSSKLFAALAGGSRKRPRSKLVELMGSGKAKEAVSNQLVMARVLEPFLSQLVYRGNVPTQWFPLERSKLVLLDPQVRFGAPMVRSGVPTEILWRNHHHGGASVKELAHWWRIPEPEVRDAVRWENTLRNAA